jgi:hypothetical protein
MKSILLLPAALFLTALAPAQSAPDLRFDGHMLGETAKAFFTTATMAESKAPTKESCRGLLNDPQVMKRYEAAQTEMNKKDFLLSDVGGCKSVMTAVDGGRAWVGARFASELGKGHVLFVGGKLVCFVLNAESPYADVVEDMSKRFGASGIEANLGDPKMKALRWDVRGVSALVFKLPSPDVTIINIGYTEFLSRP